MTMKTNIQLVDDYQNPSRKAYALTIDLDALLNSLPQHARREFVGYAIADGELLKMVCRQIATTEDCPSPEADVLLDSKSIGDMREALAPLLGDAVAAELKEARETAEKYRRAESALRSIAHVWKMLHEAHDDEDRRFRREQLDMDLNELGFLYPEHAIK